MIDNSDLQNLTGQDVYGTDGDKIGKVGQIYLDDDTGKPEWATVQTGLFGNKETFVPIVQADVSGDGLRVPVSKEAVKGAPNIDTEGHLSKEEEAELYRHYGMDYGDGRSPTGLAEETSGTEGDVRTDGAVSGDRGTVGRDTSGPTTDDAMTRSEERLKVGTEQRETGKARLRKYVVTEQQNVTVPVTREEVRVEREPITDANRDAALDGPAISEEEHEVTLHEERPVVEKEAVPVERVRLAKDQVTDERQVSEEVRKEQIETEGTGTTVEDDRR